MTTEGFPGTGPERREARRQLFIQMIKLAERLGPWMAELHVPPDAADLDPWHGIRPDNTASIKGVAEHPIADGWKVGIHSSLTGVQLRVPFNESLALRRSGDLVYTQTTLMEGDQNGLIIGRRLLLTAADPGLTDTDQGLFGALPDTYQGMRLLAEQHGLDIQ